MENEQGLRRLLRSRDPASRKGDNGRLLVVGGSSSYFGAPALASLAALRAGADLVYTLVPSYIAPTVASYSPDLIVWGYKGELLNPKAMPLVKELYGKSDALVIGNGLTDSPVAIRVAQEILRAWEKPAVVDADAIGRVKPKEPRAPKPAPGDGGLVPPSVMMRDPVLYTPHDGEFFRLFGKRLPVEKSEKEVEERAEMARKEAQAQGGVILLKGKVDIITDGVEAYLNRTGNSAMTCGGTGDVLAGLAGAFLSQGYPLVESARLSAYINGLAGDFAFKELGYSMRATDVIRHIPKAFKALSKK